MCSRLGSAGSVPETDSVHTIRRVQLEFRAVDDRLLSAVLWICRRVAAARGRAHVVGGCVRDALLGAPVGDFDLEVFGVQPDALRRLLGERFELDQVGESFGVLKVRGLAIDIALPRRESKSGLGHRAFDIASDPCMSPEEAAARRDFTVNAIAYDPLRERLVDPVGGADDLRARVLRHTSERFREDPLRVLRGMQFVARFELRPAAETLALCREIDFEGLAPERVFEEWRKLVLRGVAIGSGLRFLEDAGWLRFFPEIAALRGCPQDPEWHPEGDVLDHLGHVMDAFALRRLGDPWEDLVVGLACLCHDFGKPATTQLEDGRWRSKGHEAAGEAPTRTFLARITRQQDLVAAVVPLVVHHLKPFQLYAADSGAAAVRRLALKVRIDRLVRVARADSEGRPPLEADGAAESWLLARAEELSLRDQAPRPLVLGRHLIDRGLEPGPRFGPILRQCFEAQLEGEFHDVEGGLEYLDGVLLQGRP